MKGVVAEAVGDMDRDRMSGGTLVKEPLCLSSHRPPPPSATCSQREKREIEFQDSTETGFEKKNSRHCQII